MSSRRRRVMSLARACVLPLAMAGASGCGETETGTGHCRYLTLTLEGVVPLPFDEFAAGSFTWCAAARCTTARVKKPLWPSPDHPGWYEMTSGGRARPVDAGSTEVHVLAVEERGSPVTVTVTDASDRVVLETEQPLVEYQGRFVCPEALMTIGAEPDAGPDAG
jgi:hypothetical protein